MTQPTFTNDALDIGSVESRLKSVHNRLSNESRQVWQWFLAHPDQRPSLSAKAAEIGIPSTAMIGLLRQSFPELSSTLFDDESGSMPSQMPTDDWTSRYGHYFSADFQDKVTQHFYEAKQQALAEQADDVTPDSE